MIIIYCGTDSAVSRTAYTEVKQSQQAKEVEVVLLNEQSLPTLSSWLYDNQLLFAQKKIFFGENLLSKKVNRDYLIPFDVNSRDTDIIIWEETQEERDLKRFFKQAKIIASNLPKTIFTFLDSIYPTNTRPALGQLNELKNSVDENIIFFMTVRRIRELVTLASGVVPEKLAPWQLSRLQQQTRRWQKENLLRLYDALYRVESNIKGGQTPYSPADSLEMVLCYYL